MVQALLDVVEASTRAILERLGSQTAHRVCNLSWIDELSLLRPPQHS